jgi:hypothetical protein
MRWNHLPVAGGIYDQHPELIRKLEIVFEARAKHEAKEERKRKHAEMGGGRKVAGRR